MFFGKIAIILLAIMARLLFSIPKNFDQAVFKDRQGVTFDPPNRIATFENWGERDARKLLDLGEPVKRASFEIAKKQVELTEEDFAILRGMGIGDEDHDKLTFFRIKAANSKIAKLAELSNTEKTSLIYMHNPHAGIFGRAYKSFTEVDENGVTWLIQKAFVFSQAKIPGGIPIKEALQTRIIKHTSIGFAARAKIEELPDNSFIGVFDDDGGPIDIIENSFVHLGAQIGAEIPKSYKMITGNAPGAGNEPNKSKLKKSFKMIELNGKSFTGDNATEDALTYAKEIATELQKAKSDLAEAQKAVEQVQALRKSAIDRITVLQGKDALNIPAPDQWDDAEMSSKSIEKLLAKRDRLEAKWAEGNQEQSLNPGTPDNGNGGQQNESQKNVSPYIL